MYLLIIQKIIAGLFLGLFILQISNISYSQDKYLVLEKLGRKKRIVFYPGDEITYKIKSSNLEITNVIEDLHDSLILFANSYVKPSEIDYVKLEHTRGLLSPGNGPKLMIAGVALFLIDQLNHSIIQGNDIRLNEDIVATSLVLFIGGAIWKSFKYSKFKNKGNRRVRIVVL